MHNINTTGNQTRRRSCIFPAGAIHSAQDKEIRIKVNGEIIEVE